MLWAICDSVVDDYETVAESVEIDVDEVENSVFSPDRTSDAERIYKLKREVLEMRRAVRPLRDPMEQFAHGDVPGSTRRPRRSSATSSTTSSASPTRPSPSTRCSARP